MTTKTTPPRRRTQAERTAATRAALLAATIDSLVESGYAGVTAAQIAERAGVTRGAQAHHFHSKNDLVLEAVRHLAAIAAEELPDHVRPLSGGTRSIERALDALWAVYQTPLFIATIELWLASRTDPELRAALQTFETEVADNLNGAYDSARNDHVSRATMRRLLSTTSATMRGLTVLRFVRDDVEPEWRAARRHLASLWQEALRPSRSD
jgi:AcrR family transcriptional regulator